MQWLTVDFYLLQKPALTKAWHLVNFSLSPQNMMYEARRVPLWESPAISPLWGSTPVAHLRKLLRPESWGCARRTRSRAFGTRSAATGRKRSHWARWSCFCTGQGPVKDNKRVCHSKQQGDRTKSQHLHFHCKAKAWLDTEQGAGWHQPRLQCHSTAWPHGAASPSPPEHTMARKHLVSEQPGLLYLVMGFYVACFYYRIWCEGDINNDILIPDKIGCRKETQPHTRNRTLSRACDSHF